jgi:hypothetical protein
VKFTYLRARAATTFTLRAPAVSIDEAETILIPPAASHWLRPEGYQWAQMNRKVLLWVVLKLRVVDDPDIRCVAPVRPRSTSTTLAPNDLCAFYSPFQGELRAG